MQSNYVTSIAADKLGRWLVTADSGPDNIVIVWDAQQFAPCRTIFAPHGILDISKVAISADAKYLVTLAYRDKAVIHWWIWSFGFEFPHGVYVLQFVYSYDIQNICVYFLYVYLCICICICVCIYLPLSLVCWFWA